MQADVFNVVLGAVIRAKAPSKLYLRLYRPKKQLLDSTVGRQRVRLGANRFGKVRHLSE
jgi:hypothetical protein